jgi:hypothetical protein
MSIVNFYRGIAPDYLGRRLDDILALDDEHLEMIHNYIQVLFPLPEASMFNYRAPILDQPVIDAFRQDERLRSNLMRSFERMLTFYGFHYDSASGRASQSDDFAAKALNWLWAYNHNHRRITRILRSMTLLGLEGPARAFFDALAEVYRRHTPEIGEETFRYWQEAIDPARWQG